MSNFKLTPIEDDSSFRLTPVEAPSRSVGDIVGDIGITALKGAISLPEAFVGLADIPTGGSVGKVLAEAGYRPDEAKKTLDALYSDAQQEANRRVQSADGFGDTIKAAVENPSVIATAVGESLPSMVGGAGVARGILKVAPKVAPFIAGAAGEGIIGAGSAAESIRNETSDKLLTPVQSAAAVASGVGTGVLGAVGGKIAAKLGVADVDTILAKGAGQASKAGFMRQVVGSGISEGAFEELPQSMQEQMWQNFATGKPIGEGVGNAGAMGLLSGAAMGGAGGGYNAFTGKNVPPDNPATPPAAEPEKTPDIQTAMAKADGFIRLGELDSIAEDRPLNATEQGEYQTLLTKLNEEDHGQDATAADAQMDSPSVEGGRTDVPGSGNVLVPVSDSDAGNPDVSTGVAETGVREAAPVGAPGAPGLTYRGQPSSTRVLDQKPVELAMPKLSPVHVDKVAAIESRINEIAAELPTRSKPVQKSLQREAEALAKEKEGVIDQAHADEGADPELMAQYNAAKVAGNNDEMRRLAHEINGQKRKKAPEAKPAEKAEGLSIGTAPNAAEPVTVRNGVVHVGNYPAQDFDSGEDVKVSADATPFQIRDALTKAGAIGRGQKMFGLPAETKAPKQSKQDRKKLDASKDSLFMAIAKLGGMDTQELLTNGFDSNDITQETAARVSKKTGKLGKKSRKPVAMGFAMPLHKKGGMSFDGMLEALKQHGYFGEDATKNDAIDAFRAELGGEKYLTPDAQMQKADQDQAEYDAMMAAEQDRIDAENAAEEAAKEESGYDDLSDDAQEIADDFPDIDDIDNQSNAQSEEDAMRALGFTEEEINEQTRQSAEPGNESVAGESGHTSEGSADSDRASRIQDGQGQREVPEGAKPVAGNEEGGKGSRAEVADIEQGRVGMKLAAGQIVLTTSGRKTTPFPKFQSSTGKMNKSHLAAVDTWLLENAKEEALSRGDEFNGRQFERDHYDAVNRKTVPQASKDAAEEYLFGEQPAVVPSILKSLVPDQNGGFVLAGQTPAEVKAQEAKRKAEEAKKETEEKAPTVKADQVDLFNTQGGLFNSNREAPKTEKKTATRAPAPFEPKTLEFEQNGKRWRITVDRYWKVPVPDAYNPDLLTWKAERGAPVTNSRATYTEWKDVPGDDVPVSVAKKASAFFDNVVAAESGSDLLGPALPKAESASPAHDKEGADLTWPEVLEEARMNGAESGDSSYAPVKKNLEKAYQRTLADEQVAEYAAEYQKGASESGEKVPPEKANTASWVIRDRATGAVIMETFDRKKVEALNLEKYEAIPIQKHLAGINKDIKAGEETKKVEPTQAPSAADNAKEDAAQQQRRENPNIKTGVLEHAETMERLREGTATLAEYKAAFERLVASQEEIKSELGALTKDALFKKFPVLAYRYKNDKKAEIVKAAYRSMMDDFVLADSFQWSMGQKYESVIRGYVEKETDESLRQFAEKVKRNKEDRQQAREDAKQAIADPKTLEDFGLYLRAKINGGMSEQEARLSLSPEQRAKYDDLFAEKTRSARTSRSESAKTEVRVAAQTTTGQVIETKHTKTGEPLFVVKAADRVERDVYSQWNAAAKKLGGWYSSFRGNGAVPGFQFKTRENADAFLSFLGGDVQPAQEMVKERRDAFADDRSQSAVERLTEMADRLEEKADESLGRERKANTDRRARFAASAEAAASGEKALAKTMRNIAKAIENGKAKFLDRVRQKAQVEMLRGTLATAKNEEIRAKYPTYLEQERHKGEKATAETADYARWPSFTAFRSDLASLGRELSQIDGAKKIGKQLLAVADDVTDAYKKFAKDNLHKVSVFSKKREGDEKGEMAVFGTADAAENAIVRSGYKGKAISISFKRGQHLVIMGPEMAREAGHWQGDDDQRITLRPEAGEEIVSKVRELKGQKISMPWVFDSASTERARWKSMGIESASEMRAALREFVSLQEAPAEADKIKQMERAMIGRRNDGLDFFPTPAAVAQDMIDAAGIKEGMRVLEPSAGMGHIAEQIREAGADPDVVEMSGDRRELLEAKGFNVVGNDFTELKDGEYDRIIMNPPFSDRRDAEHVQHAYSLLKPGGRLVAIMGEGVFYGQDKKAQAFREWLDEVGGTSEKLPEGTFLDPSLPVNTGVNARMVVVDKPEGGTAMFSRKGAWYFSNLARQIEAAPDKVFGPAKQVKAWLQSNAGKLGIKADEIQWTGINDWLDMQAGKVGKADVLAYLDANGVQVQEVVKGVSETKLTAKKASGYSKGELEQFPGYEGIEPYDWLVFNESGGWVGTYQGGATSESGAIEGYRREAQDEGYDGVLTGGETKYGKYQLHGGEDYRELLLTLPVAQSVPTFEQWNDSREFRGDTKGTPEQYEKEVGFYAKRGTYGDRSSQFRSSHWDEPNILAHVRFNSRTDAEGKKVLFIEELQSDWGQAGKKQGFAPEKLGEPISDDEYARAGALQRRQRDYGNLTPEETADLNELMRRNAIAYRGTAGPPAAPFVTDTKAWVALAVKRMIAHAAQNGYDKVAFVTGEQSADRYDLSKQVDSLLYRKNPDGTYYLSAITGDRGNPMGESIKPEKLEDYVGKEVAKKIIDGAGKRTEVQGKYDPVAMISRKDYMQELSGIDLKVGGEGMKTFYDQIVPQVVNDVLKKVGGGRVESVRFGSDGDLYVKRDGGIYVVADDVTGATLSREYAYESQARSHLEQIESDRLVQPGFTITPAMRENAASGLPLFARSTPGQINLQDLNAVASSMSREFPGVPIITVEEERQLPKALREEIKKADASGDVSGVFHAGKIYLIQSNIAGIEDAQVRAVHEVVHAGLAAMGVSDETFLNIGVSNPKLHNEARKIKAKYGYSFVTAIEEAMADMGPAARKLAGWKRVIANVRAKLRKLGFVRKWSDNDVEFLVLRALRVMKQKGAAVVSDKAMYSSLSANHDDEALAFAAEFVNELAIEDDAFRYAISKSKTLEGNLADALPGVEYLGEDTRPDEREESKADHRFVFAMPNEKIFYVYTKGKEVWIDVSRLLQGDKGSAVYHGVANYAYNTGKTFIGDPLGLSEDAVIRRTAAMLSSAVRFGTTSHLGASREQMNGDPGKGIEPLAWRGDDVAKTKALIHTYVKTLQNLYPEIIGSYYDFASGEFRDGTHRPLRWLRRDSGRDSNGQEVGSLDAGGSDLVSREARAGKASVRRGILLQSLMASESSQKPELLEYVLRRSTQLTAEAGGPFNAVFSRADQGNGNGDNRAVAGGIPGNNGNALPAETRVEAARRQGQDKFLRFKVVQDWLKAQGVNVSDLSNVHRAETLMHGRVSTRIEDFREKHLQPLIKRIQKAGFALTDIAEYLEAKHTPEANQRQRDLHKDPDATAAGVTDAEAQAIIQQWQAKPNFAEFSAMAEEVRSISDQTRDMLVKAGILSPEMAEAWQKAYQHYVPLKGGPVEPSAKMGAGPGLSVKAKQKRRLGHGQRDEFVIENIIAAHEKAIRQVEKNRVGRTLALFLNEANNEEVGTIGKPAKRQALKETSSYEVLYHGTVVEAFHNLQDAQNFVANESGRQNRSPSDFVVTKSIDPIVTMMASPMLAENEAVYYLHGKEVRLQLNDPYLARAYKNLGVEDLGKFLSIGRDINSWLSKAYTGYNPEFLLVNIVRDFTAGLANMTGDYGAGFALKVVKNYPAAMKAMWKSKDGNYTQLIKEYRDDGGSTGAAYLSDLERVGNNLQRAYDDARGMQATWKAGRKLGAGRVAVDKSIAWVMTYVEHLNRVGENAMRVALYQTLREAGKPRAEAAEAAKNVTVNFNRKGEVAAQAGAMYLFFNPSVQGTAKLLETMLKSPHKKQAWAMIGAMAGMAFMLANLGRGDDEDEWRNIPSHVKDRNLVLKFGDTQITLPVPYGYGFFHMIGNAMSDLAHGVNAGKVAMNLTSGFFEHFSPVGNPFAGDEANSKNLVQLLPTLARIPGEIAVNRTGLGGPVMPEKSEWDKHKPDSQTMFRTTKGGFLAQTAEAMNDATGGTKYASGAVDVSPETLKYLIRTTTGGTGTFIGDSLGLAYRGAQGAIPELREIPIVRKFVREETIQDVRRRYYEATDEAKKATNELAAAKRNHDTEGVRTIVEDKRELIAMGRVADKMRKSVAAQRDAQDRIMQDEELSLPEKRSRVKALENEEAHLYNRYLKLFQQKEEERSTRKAVNQ